MQLVFKSVLLAFSLLVLAPKAPAAELSEYDLKLIQDYIRLGYHSNGQYQKIIDSSVDPLVKDYFTVDYDNPVEAEATTETFKYLRHLRKALDKMPNYVTQDEKSLLFRGIYSTEVRPEDRFKKGQITRERRFNSTSKTAMVAAEFAIGKDKNSGCGGCPASVQKPESKNIIFMEISSKTGKDISLINGKEAEVLFNYGVIFKVIEAKRETKKALKAPCPANFAKTCEYKNYYLVQIQEMLESELSEAEKQTLAAAEQKRLAGLIAEHQKYKDMIHQGKGPKVDYIKIRDAWIQLIEKWTQDGSLDAETLNFEEGGG